METGIKVQTDPVYKTDGEDKEAEDWEMGWVRTATEYVDSTYRPVPEKDRTVRLVLRRTRGTRLNRALRDLAELTGDPKNVSRVYLSRQGRAVFPFLQYRCHWETAVALQLFYGLCVRIRNRRPVGHLRYHVSRAFRLVPSDSTDPFLPD